MAPAKKPARRDPAPKKEVFQFSLADLLEKVKPRLILDHAQDDEMLEQMVRAAMDMAAKRQHRPGNHYLKNPMSPCTEQAVIMWVIHLYESRDGSTGGFFNDSPQAGAQSTTTINDLLALDKEWVV